MPVLPQPEPVARTHPLGWAPCTKECHHVICVSSGLPYHRSMPVSARIRDLVTKSQSEDSAVSWPAMRLLGLLAESHFAEAVAALEQHGECKELERLEADLERISSEVAPT